MPLLATMLSFFLSLLPNLLTIWPLHTVSLHPFYLFYSWSSVVRLSHTSFHEHFPLWKVTSGLFSCLKFLSVHILLLYHRFLSHLLNLPLASWSPHLLSFLFFPFHLPLFFSPQHCLVFFWRTEVLGTLTTLKYKHLDDSKYSISFNFLSISPTMNYSQVLLL